MIDPSARQAARAMRELREVFLDKMMENILWDGDHSRVEMRTEGVSIIFEAQVGLEGSVRLTMTWEIRKEDYDEIAVRCMKRTWRGGVR